MTTYLTTDPTTCLPMPTDPEAQIRRIVAELRARTESLARLTETTMPDSGERAAIIAAQRALAHDLINMISVLNYLVWRVQQAEVGR